MTTDFNNLLQKKTKSKNSKQLANVSKGNKFDCLLYGTLLYSVSQKNNTLDF